MRTISSVQISRFLSFVLALTLVLNPLPFALATDISELAASDDCSDITCTLPEKDTAATDTTADSAVDTEAESSESSDLPISEEADTPSNDKGVVNEVGDAPTLATTVAVVAISSTSLEEGGEEIAALRSTPTSELYDAINAVPGLTATAAGGDPTDTDRITVTGFATVANVLQLTIPAGVTLEWQANLSGRINLQGQGAFILRGGNISAFAIDAVVLTVGAGINVTLESGSVANTGGVNAYVIRSSSEVVITGEVVLRGLGDANIRINAAATLNVASGGNFWPLRSNTLTNNGVINVAAENAFLIEGTFVNSGVVNIASNGVGSNIGIGSFTNKGEINIAAGASFSNWETITNEGTINSAGNFSSRGAITNEGTINSAGNFSSRGAITNEGTINVCGEFNSGVPLTNLGTITSRLPIAGTVSGNLPIITGTHFWGEKKMTLAPTCLTEGSESVNCLICGEQESFSIPALGHIMSGWTVTTPATCTRDGVETNSCTRVECAESETRPIPATGHSWGQWSVTAPATTTAEGTESRTCSLCEEVETRPIARLSEGGQANPQEDDDDDSGNNNNSGGTQNNDGDTTGGQDNGGNNNNERRTVAAGTAATNRSAGPKTGDDSSTHLWLATMLISASAALAALNTLRRKKAA